VQHVLIIANARITATTTWNRLYQSACAKIDFLERQLERNLEDRHTSSAGVRCRRNTREKFEEQCDAKVHRGGDIYQVVLSQRFGEIAPTLHRVSPLAT